MTNRPEFLQRAHKNGETIVNDFRSLPKEAAADVDKWLLVNSCYGSITWQEAILWDWIEYNEDLDASYEVAA